jgi:hypothetical protein
MKGRRDQSYDIVQHKSLRNLIHRYESLHMKPDMLDLYDIGTDISDDLRLREFLKVLYESDMSDV